MPEPESNPPDTRASENGGSGLAVSKTFQESPISDHGVANPVNRRAPFSFMLEAFNTHYDPARRVVLIWF